jgi:abhydrolase domain-containing protein 6
LFELSVKILIGFGIGLIIGLLFRVFSRPKAVKYKGLGVSKFVELDGIEYHFVQEGKGPDLLLIHGIGANLLCWRQLWRPLTKFYRVTALDLPGFGHSSKKIDVGYDLDSQTDRVAAFLEALEIKKTYVLGCSMGGAIALWLNRTRPELVQRVVAISPAVHHRIIRVDTNRLWIFVHILKYIIVNPFLVRMILRRILTNHKDATLDTILDYYAPYHKSPAAVVTFWKAFDLLKDKRLPQELSEVTCPVLVLYGRRDRMVKTHFIENLPSLIKDSSVVYHDLGGHHLMNDEPRFVAEEVKKFLGVPQLSLVK